MNNKSISDELNEAMGAFRRANREIQERRFFQLLAAHKIANEVFIASSLDECTKMIVNKIADLMSVERVSLMLMDRTKGELVIKKAKGMDEEIVKLVRAKIGEGIAGWVAKTGEPLLIKDIKKDERFVNRPEKEERTYYTDSLLSVPLKIKDRVVGVINVNNKISKAIFEDDDLELLKSVADLAVMAIENTRFHEAITALDRLRTEFIANVSHELRTPLAIIKETVEVILDGTAGSLNAEQKSLLEISRNSISRLERLINEVLSLARLEAEKTAMNRKLFDVGRLVSEVSGSLKKLAAKNNISLLIAMPDKKIEMWGDEDKITQVIINLVDNAIKYNKPGGKVEVALEDVLDNIRLIISDTGIGIAEESLEKVFDRFYSITMAVKGKPKGTGIGLSIVKEIVHVHGGTISAESELGKGTKFIVKLPKDLRKRT